MRPGTWVGDNAADPVALLQLWKSLMGKTGRFPTKLQLLFCEAKREKYPLLYRMANHVLRMSPCEDYAIFPRRVYKKVAGFDHRKTIDYCFIGAYRINEATLANRKWIESFARRHFTNSSYLQFTDQESRRVHAPLGVFDHTCEQLGFVPREHPRQDRAFFDEKYYRIMAKSRFVLCPAGDASWSMRFYEALMCKAIPILSNPEHAYRSQKEALLDYKYYLVNDEHVYHREWAEHNYRLFLKYHTLSGRL